MEIEQNFNNKTEDYAKKNIRQSLEFLGELLVKPILFSEDKEGQGITHRQPSDIWTDGLDLPPLASNQLRRSIIQSYSGLSEDIKGLYSRLIDIGVPIEESQELDRKLYHRINFSPTSLDVHLQESLKQKTGFQTDIETEG